MFSKVIEQYMPFKGTRSGQETHIRNRFLAELLTSCSATINMNIEIGGGFSVSDIMNNLDTAGEITGFSGVYIDLGGSMPAFRAMAAKTKLSPLRSATFAIKKYGLQNSWMKAIKERALFVGYKGHIPDLPHPPIETIERYCKLKKGTAWMEDKKISQMLIIASTEKRTDT